MRTLLAIGVAVLSAACQSEAASAPAEDPVAVSQEVAAEAERVMDAAAAWDEDGAWGSFSAADSVLFVSEGVATSVEGYREGWRQAAATSSRQSLVDRATRVQA